MYLTCGSHTLPADVVNRIAAFLETTEEDQCSMSFCVRPMKPEADKPVAVLRAFFDRVVEHFETHRPGVPPPPELTTSEERHEWYKSRAAAPSKAVKTALDERETRLRLLHEVTAVEVTMCSEYFHPVARGRPLPVQPVIKWTKKGTTKNEGTKNEAKPLVDVDPSGTDVDRRAAFGALWGLHCFFMELTTSPQWKCEVIAPDFPTVVNDAEGPYLHSIRLTRPHPFFQPSLETVPVAPPVLEGGVDFYEVALQKDRELGVEVKEPKKKPEPKRKPEPKKKPAAKRRKQ